MQTKSNLTVNYFYLCASSYSLPKSAIVVMYENLDEILLLLVY